MHISAMFSPTARPLPACATASIPLRFVSNHSTKENHSPKKRSHHSMKFLFDLFPVILFFAVFKWGEGHAGAAHDLINQYLSGVMGGGGATETQAPILLATAVAIFATAAQIIYLLVRRKKVDGMLWV